MVVLGFSGWLYVCVGWGYVEKLKCRDNVKRFLVFWFEGVGRKKKSVEEVVCELFVWFLGNN